MKKVKVENLSKEELLSLKDDYIYHGSHTLFDVCKPQQSHCETHAVENEQNAIYGSDNILFSILFAFRKLPSEHFSWSASVIDNRWCGVLYDQTYIDKDDFGYIYCFEKSHFEQTSPGGNQFVCKTPLQPKRVIKVYYSDFKDLFIRKNSGNSK